MYELWKTKHITLPSEFWNASEGDKIALRAFHDYEIEEKSEERRQMLNNKISVFPTISI